MTADDVVEVENLTKEFILRGPGPRSKTTFKAVDDVSFAVRRGTTMAVVGESGSGKSTVANMILNLLEPTAGRVIFDGTDMATLTPAQLFKFRRRVQPIFQNPVRVPDPMYSIYRTIEEPLRTHRIGNPKPVRSGCGSSIWLRCLPRRCAVTRMNSRAASADRHRRALALEPEVVVCDEAVSALDVLVQAQILDLLGELQSDLGLSYLFITHDLAVVRQIADEVCVMKDGRIVEAATTDEVFGNPQQDYTRDLLDAIPGAKLDIWA